MKTARLGMGGNNMKRALVFTLLWTAASLPALRAGGLIQDSQERTIERRQAEIARLEERFIPLRFRITGREENKLTAEFRFYSLLTGNPAEPGMEALAQNREIPGGRASFDLEGTELFIDALRVRDTRRVLLIIPAGEVNWVFPYRVFTDAMKPDEGRPVFPYYDRDNFPAIYEGLDEDSLNRNLLSLVFTDLKTHGRITDRGLRNRVTGNAVHDVAKFSRYKTGVWYSLAVNMKNGAMEIIEEDR
jgi:hypothetical protein